MSKNKFQFNWGTGIIIAFALFMGTIGWRIFLAYQRDVDLISKDYYPKGIAYETHLEKERNTLTLSEKPSISLIDKQLEIIYPKSIDYFQATGTVLLYFPSQLDQDQTFDLMLDNTGKQIIRMDSFNPGKYIIKINWQVADKEFYIEQSISLK